MTDTLARPPVGFERVLAKRALLSALGPLAGLRAEGNVTATATGAPVVLPAFTYGVPVRACQSSGFTDAACTRTSTWSAPGVGVSICSTASSAIGP